MKPTKQLLFFALFMFSACSHSAEDITSSAHGEVITGLKARATGGGNPFDGSIDSISDLDDLVQTAWGNGRFGLHRGHAPIERVLEKFLGISHRQMHVFMEESNLNLAGVCTTLGFEPKNLIDTLTNSFAPYIQEAVNKKLITKEESNLWTEKVRKQFTKRVFWEG